MFMQYIAWKQQNFAFAIIEIKSFRGVQAWKTTAWLTWMEDFNNKLKLCIPFLASQRDFCRNCKISNLQKI